MTAQAYKPYYLEAITSVNENNFFLDIRPNDVADIDFYHEIHIEAPPETFHAFKRAIGQYIYIDLLSPTKLDVYEGEFYEESTTDGSFGYSSFEIKKLEKRGRTEWKPAYNMLLTQFKKLFAQKVKLYEITRKKVVAHYQAIYNEQIASNDMSGLTRADLDKGGLFNTLYRHSDNNPAWDGLSDLIEPGYLTAPTPKDWGLAYAALQQVYKNLQAVDVIDYTTIRNHMITRYARTFKHMLRNLPYNYKDIDTTKYEGFFQLLMNRLDKTSD
jgi:hypothetical protein